MKEWVKHAVDCGLAVAISFLSTTIAAGKIDGYTLMINAVTGLLVGLIKFRDYWQAAIAKDKKTPTIFF